VVLENGGHRFDILPDQAYDRVCADTTRDILAHHTPRIAYFGTLAQRSPGSRQAAQAFMQSVDCPLFLDINLRPPWIDRDSLAASLAAADIVKLNDAELAAVAALFGFRETVALEQAARLMQVYGPRQVLVTCGAEGSWLLREGGVVIRAPVPAQAAEIVDTVGAGDAYAAVFLLGTLMGWEPAVTLQRAGDYAAAICTVRGAAPPDRAFVDRFSQAWTSIAAC
jgi:fructokinase